MLNQTRRKWVAGALVAFAGATLSPSGTASAETFGQVAERPAMDPGAATCSHGVPKWRVVEWYHAPLLGRVPLRCGRWSDGHGWGFRKLVAKGRWDPWFRDMTAAVVEFGELEAQGTAVAFRSPWFTYCDPEYRFVVVVETRRGGHPAMMGVITAYKKVGRPG